VHVLVLRRDRDGLVRRVTIASDVPTDLPVVLGDRVQLQQVLLNLIVNAIDAMATVDEPDRKVDIRARREADDGRPAMRISVTDRGVGFPGTETSRLFEPFSTTKPNGMGIGLAISRTIVEAHRGRLWAEPNPDGGATFSIVLPTEGASAA
jgi:two-component system, LuxR family, sensor kinase FixL